MNEIKREWVDKYRPTKLDDYVLNQKTKAKFKEMLSNNNLQNCTFAGCQGMGKTTLAYILANESDADVLYIPCATRGTLDVLRTEIQDFCNAMSMDGKIKVVILDEVDSASASGQNNFQLGLRTLIESAQSDTRFILTCNIIGKVFPAIISRCPQIELDYDKKDLLLHLTKILDTEGIKYTKSALKTFIESTFKYYPDCRRIINYLQFCCNSGELVVDIEAISKQSSVNLTTDIVNKAISATNLLDVRRFYLQHKEECGDFIEITSAIFNYVVDNNIISADGILRLTDLIYQLNVVVDREPTFFGILTAIRKYKV